jgi:hypothetical protein
MTAPSGVVLSLPPDAVETIAELAARLVVDRLGAEPSPWLTRAEAADHLRVSVSRLEKDRTVPVHRWNGRVLYNRAELDEWARGL